MTAVSKTQSILAALVLMGAASSASAALTTVDFSNGDSLSSWQVDRAAPSAFEIVNDELVMSVGGGYNPGGDFYDTQGMSLNIGQSMYMSIDMYVDSSWSSSERYGGFWGVGRNLSEDITAYPVLEFQGNNGLAYWDRGWVSPASQLFQYDAFNTLAFEITDLGIEYSINDMLVYTDTSSDVSYFGDVILNAKFEGSDFDIRYDNLTYGTKSVPEPSSVILMLLGLAGLRLRGVKNKRLVNPLLA